MFCVCLPLYAAFLLFQLCSDILQLQGTGDKTNLTAFFHQPPNPPVIIKLLHMEQSKDKKNKSLEKLYPLLAFDQ